MTSEWPIRRIGDLVTPIRDRVLLQTGERYRTMGVRWHGRGAYLRGVETTETIKAKSLWRVHAGDFVFNRIDTQKGAFDVVPDALDGALVTNEFPTYRPGPEIQAAFLRLYFLRPAVLAEIDSLRAGSEGRARWKEADFESVNLPLPPIRTQRLLIGVVESANSYQMDLEVELAPLLQ